MGPRRFTSFSNVVAGALRSGTAMSHGINPSTRKPLWDIPVATAKDLDDAVTAGQDAFRKWSQTSWKERQSCLRKARTLLDQNAQAMAQLLSDECGKPPQFADLEVAHSLRCLDFHSRLNWGISNFLSIY